MPRLRTLLPLAHKRNIALFYVLTSTTNIWFVAGVWFFIWSKFMTNQEIGISDALTFAFGMLIELPSGVIADLVGRKKAIVFGMVCLAIANVMIGLSTSFWGITLWYAFWTLGYAFQSGTLEALAYDSLSKKEQERDWPKIIATSVIVRRVTSLTCTAAGGFLFAIQYNLPYLVMGALGILGVFAALALHEKPITHKHNLRELTTYTSQIKDGVSVLARRAVWPVAIVALTVIGFDYMYNWGLLRPLVAISFGYDAITMPLLQTGLSIAVIASLLLLPQVRKRLGNVRILFLASGLFSISLASFFLPLGMVVGAMAILIFSITAAFVEQALSVFINAHTKSEHRATTLSAAALITKAPYVGLALVIGALADQQQLGSFVLTLGLFALLVCVIGVVAHKRNPPIKTSANLVQ